MAGTLGKQSEHKYSYADYCQWGDETRYELIDGIAFDMGPAPSYTHQSISVELTTLLHTFFRGKPCKVIAAPFDVRLPKNIENEKNIFDVVQPDISIICDSNKIDEKGCLGAPDMIIEIVSPSSASRDHIYKRDLYEKHGVKEYWLVDPNNRITTIYRLNDDGTYGAPEIVDAEAKVKVPLFSELEINFADVFPEMEKIVCVNPPPGRSENL